MTPETAIALGNLRRRGMAVTAIVNVYDEYDFARVAGPLVAERIEVRHCATARRSHGCVSGSCCGSESASHGQTTLHDDGRLRGHRLSPALIMALVGSLVFFLIEVLYVGEYQARLMYVFALFVFAAVLIARISIESGSEYASLFALPLGLAMFLVLVKFVEHPSPFSWLINLGLMCVVWWCAHKLTWDCTLIDDDEDSSGEGLMQRIGVDEGSSATRDNELLAEKDRCRSVVAAASRAEEGQAHAGPVGAVLFARGAAAVRRSGSTGFRRPTSADGGMCSRCCWCTWRRRWRCW